MEIFSEVEWKKSSATTQELFCSRRSETCIETFLMSTRQTHFENIHKVPAMDLVHPHKRGLLRFPTSNWISYGDV